MGSIPDGLYEFVAQVEPIIGQWPRERAERLASNIQAAQNDPDPRAAVEAVIQRDPDLREVAQRLLIPQNAGQFWAMIAALVSVIALIVSTQTSSTPQQSTRDTTIIEQQAAPRSAAAPADDPPATKPPAPPRRRKPKGRGKGGKKKR